MGKDRLQELRQIRQSQGIVGSEEPVVILIEEDETQRKLLVLLDILGHLYAKLKTSLSTVEELKSMVRVHQHKDKVEDQVSKIKAEARKIRKDMEEIKEESQRNSGLLKHVAETHHHSLYTYLTLILRELSVIQIEAQNRHTQYLKKELIITGHAGYSDEELQNLLEEPPELFTQNLIRETQEARQQFVDVQARHEDFKKIENSITELWHLFMDVAQLVSDQGEKLNRIENNVYQAQAKTEKGKTELVSARLNQRKALKKKIILGVILGVVVLIITLTVVFSFV
ncbi:hypothetical protein Pcinc_034630 [Petrolisthes cinctipes]|uniref:t-SNARE coiled-coil homology domain-containing protein n=1 Tax=Petrolisthes cinctipes TaxID=88211 RepID=A0AAE1C1X8_PETCI|nr:hypothetical protein Pcinc_034630 [Petrolisthes cinctipes]